VCFCGAGDPDARASTSVTIELPSLLTLALPNNTGLTLVSLATVESADPLSSVPVPTSASTGCAFQNVSTLPLVLTATGCAPGQYVLVVGKSAAGPAANGNAKTPGAAAPGDGGSGTSPTVLVGVVAGLVALVVAVALVAVHRVRQRRRHSAVIAPVKASSADQDRAPVQVKAAWGGVGAESSEGPENGSLSSSEGSAAGQPSVTVHVDQSQGSGKEDVTRDAMAASVRGDSAKETAVPVDDILPSQYAIPACTACKT